ncbi:predicted protein [Sclerotinia sclerotiorum 1980 UF-70]|uniref:Uncharacterized protein n=1 Tax=Sclerotinia sclerotiorum (strain ATCC 18683 / 1980 / Ss-1) TaxID=665079 RepID=A7F9U2_SCLS1|nr:predicted protein [Sclerotinia sclerotiorum 1980 UF-70]EDO00503.1 predicted protein [Sclerotinia sclerotiorum 1980 UF-70]
MSAEAIPTDPGYKILDGTPPTRDKIEAAQAEISVENLQKLQQSTSDLGFERLGWGEKINSLLHDGLDLDNDEYLKTLLNGAYKDAKTYMADVVIWMQNPNQLQRFKAGRGRVFVYKAIEGVLGPQNGFFRIVEGSHLMNPNQIIKTNAKDVHLQPGQAIILDGDLVIEYPQAGGGVALLKCFSKA